jgi:phage shock protein PspC (stress-responsive transcriptional regulator)
MKKAFTITVAGTLFTVEEDAYDRLQTYLSSIQSYFGGNPDHTEIVKDIEARIAEQLMIGNENREKVITIVDVERLISIMGKVEDFGEAGNGTHESQSQTDSTSTGNQGQKKLFRNPDDVVVLGVASGLGAYFSIDPLFIRIVFILLTVFGSGGGIIVYIVLSLLMPEAKTAAEKMQMRGGPVNLHSFKETMRSTVNTAGQKVRESKFRTVLENLIQGLGKIIRGLAKLVIKLVGLALTLGAVLVMAGLVFLFVNLIFNINSSFINFPIFEVVSRPAYFALVILAFIIAAFPVIFIITLGSYILSHRRKIQTKSLLIMAGVWVIAILVAGTLSIRYLPDMYTRLFNGFGLKTKTATVSLSGVSDATLNATDKIEGTTSGNSSLLYYGTPSITIKSSGNSDVTQEEMFLED